MKEEPALQDRLDETDAGFSWPATRQLGAAASFLLAVSLIVPQLIYLTGSINTADGRMAYHLADFLYGPVSAAALLTAVFALRERLGGRAPQRMAVALQAAALAAGAMVSVALIRSANRQYMILHPDLDKITFNTLLLGWGTLNAGLIATGWHFLGWVLLMLGSAGLATGRLPLGLNVVYLLAGVASLFVYLFPAQEGLAVLLGMVWAVWQGIVLWRGELEEAPAAGDDLRWLEDD